MTRTALVRYGRIPETSRLTVHFPGALTRGTSVVVRTVRGLEMATVLHDVSPETDETMRSGGSGVAVGSHADRLTARINTHLDDTGWAEHVAVLAPTATQSPDASGGSSSNAEVARPAQQSSAGFDRELAELTGQPGILRPADDDDQSTAAALVSRCETEFATWQQRIAHWKLDLEIIDLERTLDGGKLILYVLNERGPDCTKLAIQAAAAGLGLIEVQSVGPAGLSAPGQSGGCASGGCGSGGCH